MKKVALATALSLFSTIVFAAEPGTSYVNVDVGKFILEGPNIFGLDPTGMNPTGTSQFPNVSTIRIGAGYNITPNLAVEAGYSVNPDSKISSSAPGITKDEVLKTSSMHLAAVYTYDLTEQFGVFGKVGVSSNSLKYTASAVFTPGGTATASYSSSGTGAMFGLGAKYNISNSFAVRAQYEIFGNSGNIPTGGGRTTNFTYRSMTVGGMYTF